MITLLTGDILLYFMVKNTILEDLLFHGKFTPGYYCGYEYGMGFYSFFNIQAHFVNWVCYSRYNSNDELRPPLEHHIRTPLFNAKN